MPHQATPCFIDSVVRPLVSELAAELGMEIPKTPTSASFFIDGSDGLFGVQIAVTFANEKRGSFTMDFVALETISEISKQGLKQLPPKGAD